ncbi:MAG TPA: hypothetical protein VFI17_06580 [Solirubrobacterales bacterium]|nr:hypothetical protein [Solirubrobacterales bacterium]
MIAAVAAVAALFAVCSAGSASATVMCKVDFETEELCPKESIYPVGTGVSTSLKTGTSSKLNVGFTTVACEESKMNGEITKQGELTETMTVGWSVVSFANCNATVKVEEAAGTAFHWAVKGGGLGTRGYGTFEDLKTTITSGSVSCTYGGAEIKGENLMAIAGKPGELQAKEMELPKLAGSFMCASTAKWTATYTINSPSPFSLAVG